MNSVIILPRFCNSVPENWLVLQVLCFLKCRLAPGDVQTISVEDMKFLNCNGSKETISQFVREYEYHYSLILYFKKAKYSNFHSSLFQMSRYSEETESNDANNCGNESNPANSVLISDPSQGSHNARS